MKTRGNFIVKKLIVALLSLLVGVCAFGFLTVKKSYASNAIQDKLVLPTSTLEYYDLSLPIGAYSDQDITAVMQNTDPNSLLIYFDGGFTTLNTPSLTDVNRLNDSTLIYSSEARIKQIDLNSFDANNPTASISGFPLDSGDTIATTYFELTDNYIITAYENNVKVFDKQTLMPIGSPITIYDNSRIAASSNDTFYCVYNNQIHKNVVVGSSRTSTPIAIASPTEIIANENYLYYIEGNDIYKLDVSDNSVATLSFINDQNHQLGNTTINASSRLAFRNGNLLITDTTLNAVQEFKINADDTLSFTGFAIAKNKTAFNRISASVKDAKRQGNTLAVLDNYKLSLINAGENFNTYDKTNFKHFFVKDLTGEETGVMPDTFALGDKNVLLLFNQSKGSSKLRLLNVETGVLTSEFTVFENNSIRDITFKNGNFYVLCDIGDERAEVYVSPEDQMSFTALIPKQEFPADQLEIDVFSNVYLYKSGKVYLIEKTDSGYQDAKQLTDLNNVKKLSTDLGGSLFALTDTAINYLDKNGLWQQFNLPTQVSSSNIKSMVMNYDKKVVYFVYENQELISSTTSLPNLAIDNVAIPSSFILSAPNANLQNFKSYTAKENANVYSVSADTDKGVFKYTSLIPVGEQYAFITNVEIEDGFGKTICLYALAGQDNLVLINSEQVIDVTPTPDTEVPQTAFVTTGVNGYYLPIITVNAEYSLKDTTVIRIKKEQTIKPLAKVTFLEKDFYFAEFTVDGVAYKGYVPVAFTIKLLSQDFTWNEYTVQKVEKTNVYADEQLTNSIITLEEDTKVRILSTKNGVTNIAFQVEDGWALGYINAKDVKNDAKIAIRNVLLLLVVAASVCGTTTYFVLRKKS